MLQRHRFRAGMKIFRIEKKREAEATREEFFTVKEILHPEKVFTEVRLSVSSGLIPNKILFNPHRRFVN